VTVAGSDTSTAPSAASSERRARRTVPRVVGRLGSPAAVAVAFLGGWELLAVTVFAGRHVVPTPFGVATTLVQDHFYLVHVVVTLNEAWRGWLLGNGIAMLLASTCLLAPRIEPFFLSLGVITYCVPIVAVGPLLIILASPFDAKVGMAALSVFFVTLVAAVTGLRQAPTAALDVVSGLGGGSWMALRKVRLRAAVPSLTAGLCISAPAAILGAMIGDYMGGQKGLGVAMLEAQSQLAVSRTWAIAIVATAISGLAFLATSLVARAVSGPSSPTVETGTASGSRRRRRWPAASAVSLSRVVVGVVVVIALWSFAIRLSGLNSFFAKSPSDVWRYLMTGSAAATHRGTLLRELRRSLHDAAIGWTAGMVAAMVGAGFLTLSRTVAAAVYPLILVLRSVPLVAMTPLIALVFGRGIFGVTVIAGIVTFVPSLVTLAEGLRRAPAAAIDVVTSIGGSSRVALFKVRAPYAAAAAFAAAKISLPAALLGAILAEWLITGRGLGEAMASDILSSAFSDLWSAVALVVIVSVVLYSIVGAAERAAQSRLAIP
jgi:sulfonate transport system permease protein